MNGAFRTCRLVLLNKNDGDLGHSSTRGCMIHREMTMDYRGGHSLRHDGSTWTNVQSTLAENVVLQANSWPYYEQRPSQYYEPFCGGLWVSQYVQADTHYTSAMSRNHPTLYQALMGWVGATKRSKLKAIISIIKTNRITPDDRICNFTGCSLLAVFWWVPQGVQLAIMR